MSYVQFTHSGGWFEHAKHMNRGLGDCRDIVTAESSQLLPENIEQAGLRSWSHLMALYDACGKKCSVRALRQYYFNCGRTLSLCFLWVFFVQTMRKT